MAPSVPLFLPATVTMTVPVLHSPRSSEFRKSREAYPSQCFFHLGSNSLPPCIEFSRANTYARATFTCQCSSKGPYEPGRDKRFGSDLGRCVLVSAAAAFVMQCAHSQETAISATYSSSMLGLPHPSFSVDSVNHRSGASGTMAFSKKSRKGSRMKLSILADGQLRKSSLDAVLRRAPLLFKSSGGYLPRLNNTLMLRQAACPSVGVLPIASVSSATFTNYFSGMSRLVLALDFGVLRSSFGTSINLLSLCTLVVWMQKSGQLPADTPIVLSQVAFKLFIPCFLMSKVATTLTASSASNLVALPLMALVQVIIGTFLGKVACRVFFSVPSLQPALDWSGSNAGDCSSSSTAFTEHQQKLSLVATKKQALITAACAFGNSLTLPLVFLSGVLATPEDANRAAGYLALYMVGWSPAMWSVGYKILTAGDEEQVLKSSSNQGIWQPVIKWFGNVMNPPLYGVLVGLLIGGTPLSHFFLGGKEGAVLASTSAAFDTVGTFARLRTVTAGILSPVFEAASLLGTATLAVQTVVLATSLGAVLPKTGESARKISALEADSSTSNIRGELGTSISKSEGILDAKAFWVISLVRLIILPFTGIFFTLVLQCCHMLPPDPIYRLVILAESAMPTAQNLVLLAQLNVGTRPLAGMLADLLLRQYALSVIPLTIWMAIFLTFTPLA